MKRLVEAELLKLRTTRTVWVLVAVTLGLMLLVTVLTLALDSSLNTKDDVRSLLSTAGATGLLLLILGVVVTAGEYRHGTIAWTLLVAPVRIRVVTAQTVACAAVGLFIGLAAAAVIAAIALPWLGAKEAPALATGELVGLFLGGALYTALAGALGAGLGALLRNQVAAVVILLVLLFVIDPAISALAEDYGKYSLGGLSSALTGAPASDAAGGELLPFWEAALLWATYAVAVAAGAALLTSRRDV